MLPVIALVGRPNVGKSTLFNRLTKSRDALVADFPGLTRDRHYGHGKVGPRPYLVVDTGGFEPVVKEGILHAMAKQTLQAIDESDLVIFLTDARQGLTPHDHEIAEKLRKSGRPVILAVNKSEGMRLSGAISEFYELGLGEPIAISSAHGEGVKSLLDYALEEVLPDYNAAEEGADLEDSVATAEAVALPASTEPGPKPVPSTIKLAIVGRPNVGKSTLVNTLLGEERVIAFDMPGTTRDSIYIDFERAGKQYTLIDTAGLRRRGKVFEAIEKFSVVKTLQAIADANVVVLMLDASQDVSEQDAHIAGFVVESGRALVVGVNKWDGVDDYTRSRIKTDILRKMQFLDFAKFHFISALKGAGVAPLLKSVDAAHAAAFAKLSTPKLTRVMQAAVEHQAPPRKGIFRPKMRYAHQGGQNPPIVVIHGNALDAISDSYKRYLEGRFREAFQLQGTPLRIELRSTKNPYISDKK
ncbi:ribosome biogenesis GTPase Der [Parvibium lacunae]|uniref:GTPase Der n=1 Tax=Parvibium lacunae TaxID=1888893 RepID=A0A368L822_9BURK|nr:ribosome biogenesis GTPase Der [Parvibium lacunae]RCS59848.1 ribosome biogenesis GTPase Der [Parvibium lacunae]